MNTCYILFTFSHLHISIKILADVVYSFGTHVLIAYSLNGLFAWLVLESLLLLCVLLDFNTGFVCCRRSCLLGWKCDARERERSFWRTVVGQTSFAAHCHTNQSLTDNNIPYIRLRIFFSLLLYAAKVCSIHKVPIISNFYDGILFMF